MSQATTRIKKKEEEEELEIKKEALEWPGVINAHWGLVPRAGREAPHPNAATTAAAAAGVDIHRRPQHQAPTAGAAAAAKKKKKSPVAAGQVPVGPQPQRQRQTAPLGTANANARNNNTPSAGVGSSSNNKKRTSGALDGAPGGQHDENTPPSGLSPTKKAKLTAVTTTTAAAATTTPTPAEAPTTPAPAPAAAADPAPKTTMLELLRRLARGPPATPKQRREVEMFAKTPAQRKVVAEMYLDVRGVELEIDEDPDEPDPAFRKTPVFETCQSLRRQVRAVLRRDGMTKAAFARACGDQAAGRLTRFLAQKGVMSQNTNPFFYNAYVLLEKIRIREGRPKSEFREAMEDIYSDRWGVNIRENADGPYIVITGSEIYTDEFGLIRHYR